MTPLEKSLIRLAHENQAIRPYILAALVEAKEDFFTQAKKHGWSKLKETAVDQAKRVFQIQGNEPNLVSKKIDDKVIVLQEQGTITAYAKVDKRVVSKKFLSFPDDRDIKQLLK